MPASTQSRRTGRMLLEACDVVCDPTPRRCRARSPQSKASRYARWLANGCAQADERRWEAQRQLGANRLARVARMTAAEFDRRRQGNADAEETLKLTHNATRTETCPVGITMQGRSRVLNAKVDRQSVVSRSMATVRLQERLRPRSSVAKPPRVRSLRCALAFFKVRCHTDWEVRRSGKKRRCANS